MATWLLKTEPGEYSFDDLVREKRTTWTGVSNPAALSHLRAVRAGDFAWIYHTGSEKAVVGLARAVCDAYADPDQPGTTAAGAIKFPVVDVEAVKAAKAALTLSAVKGDARLNVAGFELVRQPRLSVMPVPAAVDRVIRELTGLGSAK